ncbi:jg21815, partial [Pararge aegeria aegeria]
AWDAGVRPKTEEAAVRRVAERNALRCSLLKSEARKKQQPKQETTSLSERIRLLTCDVEDEDQREDQRSSHPGASIDKFSSSSEKLSDKSYNSIDKNNEKAFGSASSSSSSSTLSAPVLTRQHPPDLGDVHQEPQKVPIS